MKEREKRRQGKEEKMEKVEDAGEEEEQEGSMDWNIQECDGIRILKSGLLCGQSFCIILPLLFYQSQK